MNVTIDTLDNIWKWQRMRSYVHTVDNTIINR